MASWLLRGVSIFVCIFMRLHPSISTLFPYTTLFRSFRIAGGVLLFLLAVDMLKAERSRQRTSPEEEAEGLGRPDVDRKSTRLNSSHMSISYAVFCLKKNHLSMSSWRT